MCNCTSGNLEIPGSMRSLSSGRALRGPVGIARNDDLLSPAGSGAAYINPVGSYHFLTLLASILIDGSSSFVVKAVSTANGFSMPR
jgi:hypothetical protein